VNPGQVKASMSNNAACRACGKTKLKLGLDLGSLPLANSFLSLHRALDPTPEPTYPLQIFHCPDCGLIQLLDIVDRKELFDDYAFLTATADTSLVHFDEYAEELTKRIALNTTDLVVDIGSNDGTLLNAFKQRSASVLGIEPAHNVANIATKSGIPTLNEYFGPKTVEKIGNGKARIVTANNVVSHVGDLNGFIESVGRLLEPKGIFAFEVPWVVDVLRHYNFDIVYHEHLSYFGFKPLSMVLENHGLVLIDLEYFPQIHGGSLRGLAAHSGAYSKHQETLNQVFHEEDNGADFDALEQFSRRVKDIRLKLTELLRTLKKDGNRIVGYGAPAKATILLNYCSIDRSILDFVTDTTPLKQGRFIPGVRIPIVAPEEFRKNVPDFALLLAWNYKDEIIAKEREYLESGGKFIIPFPEPEIVE
jgi:SAM-dependent methyltransferase